MRGRPCKPRAFPVILDATQQAKLGRIRYYLGDSGNPVSSAQAIREAIDYMADALVDKKPEDLEKSA